MCLNYVHHFARVFLRHCLVNWLQLMHFFLNCKCCTHLPKVSCIIITPSKSYTNRSRIYADYLRRCTRYFGGNEHFAISIVRQTKWKTIVPSLLFVARCVFFFLVVRISNRLESQCFCAASHSSNLLVLLDIDRCGCVCASKTSQKHYLFTLFLDVVSIFHHQPHSTFPSFAHLMFGSFLFCYLKAKPNRVVDLCSK